MHWIPAIAALLLAGLVAMPAGASPGRLDRTFSGDGEVATLAGDGSQVDLAITRHRWIVVLGGGASPALVRYRPNGRLDRTLGGDGRTALDFGPFGVQAVAVGPAGRIVVAGSTYTDDGSSVIVMFRPNGSIDRSFGVYGVIATNDVVTDVAIQDDGKVLAVAATGLHRFLTDGTPDYSFSSNGVVRAKAVAADSIALQPDGKIVLGGWDLDPCPDSGVCSLIQLVARYTSDGHLDPTFSGDGMAFGDSLDCTCTAGVAVGTGGRVVAAATGTSHVLVTRFDPDGDIDRRFADEGEFTLLQGGQSQEARDVALQPNGKVVVAATFGAGPHQRQSLFRLTTRGTLDRAFGNDGFLGMHFDGTVGYTLAVSVQRNGRIVTAGPAGGLLALARYVGQR